MRLIDGDDLYRKVVGYNGGAVDKTVAKRLIEQMPTVDAVSRQAVIDLCDWYDNPSMHDDLEKLPSAQPYTDEEIQKMQELEQAEIQKAFQLGREDALSEIIRCKECKHRNTDECPMYYEEWIEYDEGDGFIERDFIPQDRTVSDGFCFKGERREDE